MSGHDNYLPVYSGMENIFRDGRNVYEGYQRGLGIQFGGLLDKVRNDSLYKEAVRLVAGRSLLCGENLANIFLILKFFLGNVPHGHIIEFGSYRGGSAIFMAAVCKKLYPDIKIYGLDSFTGMPETDSNIDAHRKGDFNDVDYLELQSYIKEIGLDNLEFHKGLFEDTASDVLSKAGKIAFAHIDCDIYSAVAYTYDAVKPYMVQGGYIVFDDACFSSCRGATDAVEKLAIQRDGLLSEQIYPQFVFRAK